MSQEQARRFARRIFSQTDLNVDRLLPVFANSSIQSRYFCMPPDWFEENHAFADKNIIFLEKGMDLAERAILEACRQAGVSPCDVGHIFFITTTGISTPSMDAHLFNRLNLRPGIRRTPIWGLGCAGGIAGMIRAYDWLKAYPGEIALVVALELCGLTFLRDDLSKSNFVATALFGDGCGALLMAGDDSEATSRYMLSIESAAVVTWPDTLDIMGWEIAEDGLKVVFSKSIPHIVTRSAGPAILEFLKKNGLHPSDVSYLLAHPGGAKIIEAYKQALGLQEAQVKNMRQVLGAYGNMSSATILFVFRDYLETADYRKGDWVLSTALGPGFSSESMLARRL
jgi:alkylresorcinol/alkylpyrone synthase